MATVLTGKDDSGTGAAWAQLPIGIYAATLTSVAEVDNRFEPGEKRVEFIFSLEDEADEEGNPIELRYWVNATLSPRSKLAAVAEALGFAWEIGQPFTVDDMVGAHCRLLTGRKTRERDGQTDEIAVVQSVVPVEQPKAKPVARRAPSPPSPAAVESTCRVEGCGEVVDHYTPRGTPLCVNHTAEDL